VGSHPKLCIERLVSLPHQPSQNSADSASRTDRPPRTVRSRELGDKPQQDRADDGAKVLAARVLGKYNRKRRRFGS